MYGALALPTMFVPLSCSIKMMNTELLALRPPDTSRTQEVVIRRAKKNGRNFFTDRTLGLLHSHAIKVNRIATSARIDPVAIRLDPTLAQVAPLSGESARCN